MKVELAKSRTILSKIEPGEVFRFATAGDYYIKCSVKNCYTNLRTGVSSHDDGDSPVLHYPDAMLVPGRAS